MDQNPLSQNLSQFAIDAALDSRWEEALKLNKKIIKNDPQNVDALARLARVYLEMGRCNLAKKYYSEVIKIDPYNPIASKNLRIIKSFKPNGNTRKNIFLTSQCKLEASLFLQEPGKTKIVNLLKVAEPQKLSQSYCGMRVMMVIRLRKITIVDESGDYLGILPDDVSHHLVRLIKGGNRYDLFIKSIKVNGLSVLIKETFRSKRFKNQPSFLENTHSRITEMITPLSHKVEEESEETEEQIT